MPGAPSEEFLKDRPDKRKKKGGLAALLANPEFLFALGAGLSSSSRGGDFTQGLLRGSQGFQGLQDATLNRQAAPTREQQLADFVDGLTEEERDMILEDLDRARRGF